MAFAAPLCALPIAVMAQASSNGIIELGTLGGLYSVAYGVSADGVVVVGTSPTVSFTKYHPFRWVSTTGQMYDLGTLGSDLNASFAWGVSGNGLVIVGSSYNGSNVERAFRWVSGDTAGDGTNDGTAPGQSGGAMYDLGTLGGSTARAYAVSADGTVVVGSSSDATSDNHAFRWVSSGTGGSGTMSDLGALAIGDSSEARGVSGDGAVVVGTSTDGGMGVGSEAFRWVSGGTGGTGTNDGTGAGRSGGAMFGLGTLGGSRSSATAVSSNGLVVVGESDTSGGYAHAFRWVSGDTVGDGTKDGIGAGQSGGAMYDLGTLGGSSSRAEGTSADGSVVVGYFIVSNTAHAFRWNSATGMQSVEDWLRAAGVTVADGVTQWANATSSDGSVVVGTLSNNRAFIARVAAAGSGLIDTVAYQETLTNAAHGIGGALAAPHLAMEGAHSNPLMRRVAVGQKAFWTAGDVGGDNHRERSGSLGLAEVGVGTNFGPAQFNVSLGQTWSRQNLVQNGRAKTDGTYVMAEALVPVKNNLWAIFNGYSQRGKADIARGYLNTGTQDYSTAHPNVNGWGVRARLEMDHAYLAAGTNMSPYVDLSYGESKMAAYTETGGGFPAIFNTRTEKATELRVGANMDRPLGNGVNLLGILEVAHRFEKTGARTTGQVIGLPGFDLAGTDNQQNWLRAGVGIQGNFGGGRASVMLNSTTKGSVPSYWLAANWQKSF